MAVVKLTDEEKRGKQQEGEGGTKRIKGPPMMRGARKRQRKRSRFDHMKVAKYV